MPRTFKEKIDFQKGHRQRLFQKLNNNTRDSLHDYEIVEMMLFLIFKRKDTKILAKILLQKFGSVNGILDANKQSMLEIDGIGEKAYNSLQIISAVMKQYSREKIVKRHILECFDDVIKYCKFNTIHLKHEELRIIFLNGSSFIVGDEVVQRGTIDTVEIYNREVVKKCIEVGAKCIILVHNHPSGDPTPSVNDIFCTKKIAEACEVFNIKILDHIIVGGNKHISFKSLLLLR
ncbi:MAG: DNA repair protein RadC [Holosporales bacterium]|jgi:DNA repair protein RadC|nr:DNA repair protein RadC [Holosporales bacterium]